VAHAIFYPEYSNMYHPYLRKSIRFCLWITTKRVFAIWVQIPTLFCLHHLCIVKMVCEDWASRFKINSVFTVLGQKIGLLKKFHPLKRKQSSTEMEDIGNGYSRLCVF